MGGGSERGKSKALGRWYFHNSPLIFHLLPHDLRLNTSNLKLRLLKTKCFNINVIYFHILRCSYILASSWALKSQNFITDPTTELCTLKMLNDN